MQNFTQILFVMWRETVEAMLVLGGAFLLACSLLIGGVEKLMDMQLLSVIKSQAWDTSMLLADGSVFGSVISSFTGYLARPALMSLIVFIGYWLVIRLMMHPDRKPSSRLIPA